jgi:hypothetical protein
MVKIFAVFVCVLSVALPSVRPTCLNLAVEAARTHQRRVQCVGPIRGHDHLDHAERVETVELIQQLRVWWV